MSALSSIAEIIATALNMTDKYIEDPERRLKARLEFKQKMLLLADKICKEVKLDEANKMLGDFITIINKL